jgi:hypothetical protein
MLFIARELSDEQKMKYHIHEDVSQYTLLQNSLEIKSKHNSSKRFAAIFEDFKVGLLHPGVGIQPGRYRCDILDPISDAEHL